MAGKLLHAAIVGASTLLAKELLEEISSSAAAVWDLRLLDEGEGIEGQLTSAGDEALVLHEISDASFGGVDLVFFAGTPEMTATYADAALGAGAAVVDLTGSLADRQGFLVRSSWLENGKRPDLTTVGISVPHPAALMLALVAERFSQKAKVDSLAATVLEPASQAGSAGVDELHQQTVSLLSFQELPKTIFDAQVAFNVQSALGEEARFPLAATRTRIQRDLGVLLPQETGLRAAIQLLQAPVFHGYVVSAFASLPSAVAEGELRSALGGGIVQMAEDSAPSNQAATESGDLLLSVRPDEGGVWLLMAADNLRFTARSAVAVAMELAALRPGSRVQ